MTMMAIGEREGLLDGDAGERACERTSRRCGNKAVVVAAVWRPACPCWPSGRQALCVACRDELLELSLVASRWFRCRTCDASVWLMAVEPLR
jgi:hypothetical protein